MARNFFTPINLNQLEIQNARLHNLAAAPTTPVKGQVYYDTTTDASYVWNGTLWRSLDATKLVGVIPNGALATNPLDRANHTGQQAAATISDLDSTIKAYRLDQFSAPTSDVSFGGKQIVNLGAPTVAGNAAEYSWVLGQIQSAAAGITSRPPVRVLANSNIALTGFQTIDGVTLTTGDRVLAIAQTAGAQNGVYTVAAGTWSRAVSEDMASEVSAGAMWLVTEGTSNAGTQWREATTGPIVLGTTSLSIVQFGASAGYGAGNGLTLSGNNLTVLAAPGGGISVSAAGVSVDTAVVPRKFSANVGDGSATSIVITHNLGTQDVHIQVRQGSSPFGVVECDMSATTTNTVTLAFAVAPTSGQYRVVVIG